MRVCCLMAALLAAACGSGSGPAAGEPGGRIAFRFDNTVRVIETDGTQVATLPCHTSPSLSPDGSQIACLGTPAPHFLQRFQSYVSELQKEHGDQLDPRMLSGFAFHGSINIASSDGSDLRSVAEQLAYFRVWWSRSGDRLFFQSSFGIEGVDMPASQIGSSGPLFAVGADGSHLTQLSQPVPLALSPTTWSEDLQWKVAPAVETTAGQIVHSEPQSLSLQQRIFLFPASGDQARPLTSEPPGYAHVNPSISGDARQVAYNAVRPTGESSAEATLWLVDFSGEFARQIAADCSVAQWSRDNRLLLMTCGASRIAVLDLVSGEQTQLGEGRYPVFSPDEAWVAFVGQSGDRSRIRLARLGGSETRTAIELPGPIDQLEW